MRMFFFFSSRRRHTRLQGDWSSDVCSSDLPGAASGQLYITPRANEVLNAAEAFARQMKDEYVGVEHLLLALAEGKDGAVAEALRAAGLTREKLLEAAAAVRGGQRVTSQTPEGTYEALEKYGRDLTALAQQGKLDPVI